MEIHQQLDTKKLFCNCPSLLRNDEPDFIVKRKLHVVAGEAGKVDVAAAHEASLGKEFVYQGYDTTCLVELDEEPPHQINKEAFQIALHISLLLNCKILSATQIMRKTVIDGSNTGGFQRTVLIARDGYVETSQGRVGIKGIFLEEDAARPVSKQKGEIVYRLDRLGIPLVEIATEPDIKTAEQVKEVALHIGDILRACKVKRGIGTIRQDLNLSIKNGHRVEIKGFQEPKMMVITVNKEIQRQLELAKSGKKLEPEVRNALPNGGTEFLRPMPGSARMYPETDLPLLKISREKINEAKKTLPRLRADIKEELQRGGLNEEMAGLLMKKGKIEEFKEMSSILKIPSLIAKILLVYPKEIASHEKISEEQIEENLNIDALLFIVEALKDSKISEGDVKEVMRLIAKGTAVENAIKLEKADVSGIEERIMKVIKGKPGLNVNAYMGLIMQSPEFKSKISGREAMEIIKKYVR